MSTYAVALIIGRFQPFHNGHRYLVYKALEKGEKLIIGIGSSNIQNNENPFSYTQRKKMIEVFIKKEKLNDRIIQVVALEDIPDDNKWLQNVQQKIQKIDVVIGNNAWVNSIFQQAGISVIRIPYYKRHLLEGAKIRRLLKIGEEWKTRVPSYMVSFVKR